MPAPVAAPDPGRRRALAIGAAAAVTVIVVSAVAIFLVGGASGPDGTANTISPARSTAAAEPFVVLTAPTDFAVERAAEGRYQLSWTSDADDVDFQILLVGGSENRFTSGTSYTWSLVDDPGSACFEVRTVNTERTRVSQSAAGPACSG